MSKDQTSINLVLSAYSEYIDELQNLTIIMNQATDGTLYPPWDLKTAFQTDHSALTTKIKWLPNLISEIGHDGIFDGNNLIRNLDSTDVNDPAYKLYLASLNDAPVLKPFYDVATGYNSLSFWIQNNLPGFNSSDIVNSSNIFEDVSMNLYIV